MKLVVRQDVEALVVMDEEENSINSNVVLVNDYDLEEDEMSLLVEEIDDLNSNNFEQRPENAAVVVDEAECRYASEENQQIQSSVALVFDNSDGNLEQQEQNQEHQPQPMTQHVVTRTIFNSNNNNDDTDWRVPNGGKHRKSFSRIPSIICFDPHSSFRSVGEDSLFEGDFDNFSFWSNSSAACPSQKTFPKSSSCTANNNNSRPRRASVQRSNASRALHTLQMQTTTEAATNTTTTALHQQQQTRRASDPDISPVLPSRRGSMSFMISKERVLGHQQQPPNNDLDFLETFLQTQKRKRQHLQQQEQASSLGVEKVCCSSGNYQNNNDPPIRPQRRLSRDSSLKDSFAINTTPSQTGSILQQLKQNKQQEDRILFSPLKDMQKKKHLMVVDCVPKQPPLKKVVLNRAISVSSSFSSSCCPGAAAAAGASTSGTTTTSHSTGTARAALRRGSRRPRKTAPAGRLEAMAAVSAICDSIDDSYRSSSYDVVNHEVNKNNSNNNSGTKEDKQKAQTGVSSRVASSPTSRLYLCSPLPPAPFFFPSATTVKNDKSSSTLLMTAAHVAWNKQNKWTSPPSRPKRQVSCDPDDLGHDEDSSSATSLKQLSPLREQKQQHLTFSSLAASPTSHASTALAVAMTLTLTDVAVPPVGVDDDNVNVVSRCSCTSSTRSGTTTGSSSSERNNKDDEGDKNNESHHQERLAAVLVNLRKMTLAVASSAVPSSPSTATSVMASVVEQHGALCSLECRDDHQHHRRRTCNESTPPMCPVRHRSKEELLVSVIDRDDAAVAAAKPDCKTQGYDSNRVVVVEGNDNSIILPRPPPAEESKNDGKEEEKEMSVEVVEQDQDDSDDEEGDDVFVEDAPPCRPLRHKSNENLNQAMLQQHDEDVSQQQQLRRKKKKASDGTLTTSTSTNTLTSLMSGGGDDNDNDMVTTGFRFDITVTPQMAVTGIVATRGNVAHQFDVSHSSLRHSPQISARGA